MSTQNPGTHKDRDDKISPQPGQHGGPSNPSERGKEQKRGSHKDSSRGQGDSPGESANDADRPRKAGQKGGQS